MPARVWPSPPTLTLTPECVPLRCPRCARLYTAMAKTAATFEIAAHDQNGEPRPVGGDPFAVSVRGAAHVYAKVTDLGDGKYTVVYKPSTSGAYSIAITLHGVPMPGSPFALTVLVPRADPSQCQLRGAALTTSVASQPSTFEIEFADAFRQVAHAEEVDVYVERRPMPKPPENPEAEPLPTEGIIWAVVAANAQQLIVRETIELGSERVGQIGPGQMVGVLETQDLPDGYRRAKIMFCPGSNRVGSDRLASPERSPPTSRATTRTNTPCNTPGRQTPVSTPGRHSPGRNAHPGRSPRARSPRSPGRDRSFFNNPLDVGNGQRSARGGTDAPRSARGVPGSTFIPNAGHDGPRSSTPRSARSGTPRSARTGTPRSARGGPGSTFVPSFARPLGELPTNPDRPRSPPRMFADALTERSPGEVGWVTAARDGKETLVIRHTKLDASRRRSQMELWGSHLAAEANRRAKEGRLKNATHEQRRLAKIGPSCAHELEDDSRGIGFAYGGVDPGTLHARGKLVPRHTVHYSIGRAGQYLLHVGLRQQAVALPGSPFELTVVPGAAHPMATSLPTDELGGTQPLRGVVGEMGSVKIVTNDRMGNRCEVGGAPLRVESKDPQLQTSEIDNGDGSYTLQWLGEVSGTYDLQVTIDGINVTGSPTELTLMSSVPDVPKSEVSGDGLYNAVAGDKVSVLVRCKDRFANPTTAGTAMSFGLAMAPPTEKHEKESKKSDKSKDKDGEKDKDKESKKDKDKGDEGEASTLPSRLFDGSWKAEGEYQILYSADKAGDFELHLWCDVEGNGTRQKLPGSPFALHVIAAKATAAGSVVQGGDLVANTPLVAGDRLELYLHFRDDFNNACAPTLRNKGAKALATNSDDTLQGSTSHRRMSRVSRELANQKAAPMFDGKEEGLVAKLITPTDEESITEKLRPGDSVGAFGLLYEIDKAGNYEAHFTLNGAQITGSPVNFEVKPAAPSGRLSTLHPPDYPPIIHFPYELILVAEDKFSNRLDRGGANVQARALGASTSPATCHDFDDGTYGVRFTTQAAGEYRVEVRLDNIKIKGSPHLIMFTEGTAAERKLMQELQEESKVQGEESLIEISEGGELHKGETEDDSFTQPSPQAQRPPVAALAGGHASLDASPVDARKHRRASFSE